MHYDTKGDLLGKIDLKGYAVGVTDVETTKSGVIALDQASMPPKVLYLSPNGVILGIYKLPSNLWLESGLTGISLGDMEKLLIEQNFGADQTEFLDATGKPIDNATTKGILHDGILYSVHPSGLTSTTPRQGILIIGTQEISVETASDLGGMRILGFDSDNDIYVIFEEIAVNHVLQVDQTVRKYDSIGKFIGIARVPVAEQYTYVQQGLAIGPDDNVYALLTQSNQAKIIRMNFAPKIDPILIDTPITTIRTAHNQNSSLSCIYRDTILGIANDYHSNSHYLSSTNTDGTCSGRSKPTYIDGAGTYSSVPYDWGGFDTISQYNGFMYPNTYQAGDIDTSSEEGCSRGVDCSGFVSRTWQQTSHYGTCNLDLISNEVSENELLPGDIFTKCYTHTVLFTDYNDPTGIFDYEAVREDYYDRVVYITSTWTRLSGYTPLRYNDLCD